MTEHRQEPPPAWRRFRRRGDIWRNPLVQIVVGGVLLNIVWAGVLYAYAYTVEQTHEYWRRYGASIAAEARRTNDPDRLREIIARVQAARAPSPVSAPPTTGTATK